MNVAVVTLVCVRRIGDDGAKKFGEFFQTAQIKPALYNGGLDAIRFTPYGSQCVRQPEMCSGDVQAEFWTRFQSIYTFLFNEAIATFSFNFKCCSLLAGPNGRAV